MNSAAPERRELMHIVFAGHVDHGKSTIIGRLLADTDTLPNGKLAGLREKGQKTGVAFEYAHLIDALKDEQAQAITIDAARVFFQTQKRSYILLDVPGHIEFLKNMVTGASHAEAAVLVIDASEGVQENSRRHGYLLWMLGIRKIVVLVNKMDRVGYDQAVFEAVKQAYQAYLAGLGLEPLVYIPVSGYEGDGIAANGSKMPWYDGPSLLEALDLFEKEKEPAQQALRLPVQDIYKFSHLGDDRRMVVGTLASGSLQVGDEIVVQPSGKHTHVKSLEAFNAERMQAASAGQAIAFTMQEQIYIKRGQIITRANDAMPHISTRLRVSLFWLGKQALAPNKTYYFKLGTCKEKVQIEEIHHVVDVTDYTHKNHQKEIHKHEVAEVTLKVAHPIAFDTSEKLAQTSRFVLVDENELAGGGIILQALPDAETQYREDVNIRELKWIQSEVDLQQRMEKYSQHSGMILITGKRSAGRKTLARKLERYLFDKGKLVYYLGIGSLLYGVNADLKRHDAPGGWREHVRRFAEVSHLFLDAGMILIVTAIELQQSDLDILRTVVGEENIQVVWIGDEISSDIEVDIRIDSQEPFEVSVNRIEQLLQTRGIIFKP